MLRLYAWAIFLCLTWSTFAHGHDFEQEHADSIAEAIAEVVLEHALALPSQSMLDDFALRQDASAHEIRLFLKSFDTWAAWMDEDDIFEQENVRKILHQGVGMALIRHRSGNLVCYPYSHGPAFEAGIREGDILQRVDAYTVVDNELADIAILLMGKDSAPVTLGLVRGEISLEVEVQRGTATPSLVDFEQADGFARIRIWDFHADTLAFFQEALERVGTQPVVLDLRGNAGGNLLAALRCAAELLPEQTLLSLLQKRGDAQPQRRSTREDGAFCHIGPVVIWQDAATASAAEAFIAALVDNGKAITLGQASYGKNTVQTLFPIDEGILTLTTENILGPYGESWHETGFWPHISCPSTLLEDLVKETYTYINASKTY